MNPRRDDWPRGEIRESDWSGLVWLISALVLVALVALAWSGVWS